MTSLRSWQVVDKKKGNLQMVIITTTDISHEDMNMLIQHGMKCVVLDRTSTLVNKEYVDNA